MLVTDGTFHAGEQELDGERVRLWAAANGLRPGAGAGRVLLAEDNMIAQASMRRLLEHQGMEVVCAVNGHEALERFDEGRYDVVILDILMPDLDGFEVTTRIREKERREGAGQTPVIALTSYSFKAVRDKCRSVGMNGYLAKPVSAADLTLLFTGLRERGAAGPEGTGEAPLLDVRGSLENLGGDEALYGEIVGMFAEGAPEIVQGLIAALDGGDAAGAELHAHNLKGMAATIGAQRLAELARVIQYSVHAPGSGEREAWVLRLREEFEGLMAALAAMGGVFRP